MAIEPVVASTPEVAPEVPPEVPAEVSPEVKPETRTYTQEDMDRVVAKVKKNARYQTRKEVEAYYQGRDSKQEPAKPEVKEAKPPERGDYDSYEEFLEAKAEFSGIKAASEYRIKAEEESRERKFAEDRQKVFDEFRTKTQEKYPDLEERLEAIADIVMPAGMGQAIAESTLGPDILDYFAKNPKDCERIAALTPSSAVREIGKLETRLEGGAKPEPKKSASKAPAPINPGGGGSPVDDTPMDTDTIDEWIRKERARGRKKTGT